MDKLITGIMMIFMLLGAIDHALLQNRLGLGREFVKGLNTTGSLVLSMAGIMCLAPVLGDLLLRIAAPFFQAIGADPEIVAGTCFGLDMGGFAMTAALTSDPQILTLGGVILSCTLGATIVFMIPVTLTVCRPEDAPALSKGILIAVITIPVGVLAAAVASGLPIGYTLVNAAPAFSLALLLALGMTFFPEKTLSVFQVFGSFLRILSVLALAAAGLEASLGIVLIPGMDPLGDQLATIAMIGVTLSGAYPFILVLSRVLAPVLRVLAGLLKVNDACVTGMLSSLANPFPFYDLIPKMDRRGKIIGMAFMNSANAALGDHLGFLSVSWPGGIPAMLTAKLAAGIAALIVAELVIPAEYADTEKER